MRHSTPFDWLIVGLGNPGKQFSGTRHNVGEQVISELARRHDAALKSGRNNALVAEARIGDERAVLAFPLTYMNDSGLAVRSLARRFRIEEPSQVVIVHDELDLSPATVRVKVGGGLAGHNGLRSIVSHLGTQDFVRVRIGVGKPPSKELFGVAVQDAADAVEVVIAEGPDAAMRRFNVRPTDADA